MGLIRGKGIRQWAINCCTTSMMINKNNPLCVISRINDSICNDYKVITLSESYLTVPGIIMSRLKTVGQF